MAVLPPNGVTLTYDTAGNQTYDATGSRFFDAENKIGKAVQGVTSYYYYDGNAKRARTVINGLEVWQIYGFEGELLAEYHLGGLFQGRNNPAAGSPTKEYGYRIGQMLVIFDNTEAATDDKLKWAVTDQVGSTRMLANRSGSASGIKRRDYLPFGEEIPATLGHRTASGSGYPASSSPKQKFVGYERDNETGLDFAQARYFGNLQGRFTSPDPYNPIVDTEDRDKFNEYLGQPQNWNRYVYVWNNPLRYIDPYGERVFIVAYTVGNKKGDEEFRRAAETLASEISSSKGFDSKKDIVITYAVQTKENFKFAVEEAKNFEKTYGEVEQVSLFAHGGRTDGPIFEYGTQRQDQFFNHQAQLPNLKINWSNTAIAKFYGCNTANFCQNFANAQGVSSYGFDTFSSISGKPNEKSKKYWFNPWYDGPLYLVGEDGRAILPNAKGWIFSAVLFI